MKGLCEAIIAHKEVKVNMYEQIPDAPWLDPDYESVSHRTRAYFADGEWYWEKEDEEPEFVGFDVSGGEVYEDDDYLIYEDRIIITEKGDTGDVEMFIFGKTLPEDESEAYWTEERLRTSTEDLLQEYIKSKGESK